MTLQAQIKIIDNFCDDKHAETLLFNHYNDLNEPQKQAFVIALIGKAVATQKILNHQLHKTAG